MLPLSGHPTIDAYLDAGYETVRGMSSRFAAGICGFLVRYQNDTGVAGHIAEIGAFEGRFLIALAKGLAPGQHAIGIDHFEWPNPQVKDRFEANLVRHDLANRVIPLKRDSRTMRAQDVTAPAGGGQVRFFHVDGEHTPEHLTSDLNLAAGCLGPRGIMVLDDMLHPGYPLLALTVHAFLDARPDLRVVCVIDRQDIVGAAKFVICRAEDVPFYQRGLEAAFPQFRWPMIADFRTYVATVLTPEPLLADIG